MAEEEDFEGGDSNSNAENDDENYQERPMPKQLTSLFGNVIVSGASRAAGALEAGANYVVPPNVWPDMDNIDNLVNVLTITGYAFTAFSVVGATYFLTRTAREAWQWRTWMRYRRIVSKRRRSMVNKSSEK